MNEINTGGPAFPNEVALNTWQRGGMTLRDYFAARAMENLVAKYAPSDCARIAYKFADAMLKAREA